MIWWFVEDSFDGKPMLIDRAYASEMEALQSAIANSKSGQYRIISFPTRDKRRVREMWRTQQQGMYYR